MTTTYPLPPEQEVRVYMNICAAVERFRQRRADRLAEQAQQAQTDAPQPADPQTSDQSQIASPLSSRVPQAATHGA